MHKEEFVHLLVGKRYGSSMACVCAKSWDLRVWGEYKYFLCSYCQLGYRL